MNIHEHQDKQILKKYGAVVPEGVFAFSVEELLKKVNILKFGFELNFKKIIMIIYSLFVTVELSGFLKTEGRLIVNENNEKVILKGFGLGGWLVLEGYMWNYPGFGSTTVLENEIEELKGFLDY